MKTLTNDVRSEIDYRQIADGPLRSNNKIYERPDVIIRDSRQQTLQKNWKQIIVGEVGANQ